MGRVQKRGGRYGLFPNHPPWYGLSSRKKITPIFFFWKNTTNSLNV